MPTLQFSDNFNRADGALGTDWLNFNSSHTVVSNKAQNVNTGGCASFYATEAASPDMYVEAVIGDLPVSGQMQLVAVVSTPGTGLASTGSWVGFRVQGAASDSIALIEKANLVSSFSTLTSGTRQMVVGDRLRLEVVGNTVTAYVNGSQVLTYTYATGRPATHGKYGGIYTDVANTGDTVASWDEFSIGTMETTPANKLPTVGITGATSVVAGGTVALSAVSADEDGTIVSTEWEIVSGSATIDTPADSDINITSTGPAGTSIQVRVIVVDNLGGTNSSTRTLTVTAPSTGSGSVAGTWYLYEDGLQVALTLEGFWNGSVVIPPNGPTTPDEEVPTDPGDEEPPPPVDEGDSTTVTLLTGEANATANYNALMAAAQAYTVVNWKVGTTGGTACINKPFEPAHKCRKLVAVNGRNDVLRQITPDREVILRRGTGDDAKPCNNVAQGSSTVTGVNTTGISVGDAVYVFSANPIKFTGKQTFGYIRKVTAKTATSLTVNKPFPVSMNMSTAVGRIKLAPSFEIVGGTFEHKDPTTQYFRSLVAFRASENVLVRDAEIRRNGFAGLSCYLCINFESRNNFIHNLADDHNAKDGYYDEDGVLQSNTTGNALLGYGLCVLGANDGVKSVGGLIRACRHGFSTNNPSGKDKVNATYVVESGDTEGIDFSTDIEFCTSTGMSTHEAFVEGYFHDFTMKDNGRYQNVYGSVDGKQNPDHINMRSNARFERVTFIHTGAIPSFRTFCIVLQDFFDASLPRPKLKIINCKAIGGKRGIFSKGGTIEVDGFTFESDVNDAVGVFSEDGQITGGNVKISNIATGVQSSTDNKGINLNPVQFVNVVKKISNGGGSINVTEGNNAGGTGDLT